VILRQLTLYSTVDDEVIGLLNGAGYMLILDEVMEVVGRAPIGPQDIRAALQSFAKVENKRVIWTEVGYVDKLFQNIKQLATTGNLYYHRDKYLIWTFPPHVFSALEDVFVMTYLFDAQLQRYFYDMHGILYEYRAVKEVDGRYELCAYNRQAEGREEVMQLIELYEGKLNEVGEDKTAFSVSWMHKPKQDFTKAKKNVYNYLRNICGANGSEILWTTKKDYENKLKGRGFSKSFVACNLRATNEHSDKWALAYVFNRFMNPYEKSFFQDHEIKVNEDMLAVSDLLQWIWRSRIRNGESIKLYLPSSRMRSLLIAWSRYEI
jgi:hypothetical protein